MITRTFTDASESYAAKLGGTYLLDFMAGDDRLTTTADGTTAYLGLGNDFARVLGGTAALWGEDGADRFDYYAGTANIDAGAGDDLLNVRGGTSALLGGGDGNDRFNFLANATGIQASGGSGDDLFAGYSRAISGLLSGGNGNDRFLSFGNHDGQTVTLAGGAGNDLYRLDGGSPALVTELAGEGIDTVQIAGGASYTLGANVERLVALEASSSAPAALTGNALANRITGSAGGETLSGLDGNDVLTGNGGIDTFIGGAGNDRISGGLGGDIIYGGEGRDVFVYSSTAESPSMFSYDEQDWIVDWSSEDRIDLSAVDANELIAGNQAFEVTDVLFGAPAGPQPAGSAVLAGFGGELYVLLYTDADTDPDMVIALWSEAGEAGLTPANLIL